MEENNNNTNTRHSWQFANFLQHVTESTFDTNTTITGTETIQQSARNELRRQGIAALKADLEALYSDFFDVVETKEGIVIVAENPNFTFSWELKSTIKSLDYDPFLEATNWDEEVNRKREKKARIRAEKAEREALKAKKRAEALKSANMNGADASN